MNDIFSSLAIGAKFKKKASFNSSNPFQRSSSSLLKNIYNEQPISNQVSIDQTNSSTSCHESTDLNDVTDEEINAFRNRLQIRVKGPGVVAPVATFKDMPINTDLKPIILTNVENSSWKEPTPIQMQVIPVMLQGRDVLATAPTGSGKTAAFVIPVLSRLGNPKKNGPRAILLGPTRELVEQIHREATRLCIGRNLKISMLKKSTVSNALARQDKASLSKVDLLVATPMRLLALIHANMVDLSKVEMIVLDEADKLFEQIKVPQHHEEFEIDKKSYPKKTSSETTNQIKDNSSEDEDEDEEDGANELGDESLRVLEASFLSQVDKIVAACPERGVQKALFSATLGPFVKDLAAGFLSNPVTVAIGIENAGASTIEQKLIFVGREDGKLLAIRQLVQQGLKPPVLIFVQSKERAKELFKELVYDGINVDVIHAERTQQQREQVIIRFRRGDIWVLICTDLMARGIDFLGVQMVINYDLPQSAVSYIHRIGRTGRAGMRGLAVTLFTEDDLPKLRSIANVMRLSGCDVPEWMLGIKALSTRNRRQLRSIPPKRRDITTVSKYDRMKASKRNQVISQSKAKKRRKLDDVPVIGLNE